MRIAIGIIGFGLLVVNAHCGGGMTTEEASESCLRQRQSQAQCFNDAVMAQCVSCHEECGRDCSQAETCPLQFVCD